MFMSAQKEYQSDLQCHTDNYDIKSINDNKPILGL